MKTRKIICTLIFIATFTVPSFLLSPVAYSQNFANFYPNGNPEKDAVVVKEAAQASTKNNGALNTLLNTSPVEIGLSDPSKYTLGPTDVIEITVLKHPEFSGEFTINKEGKIQYNYVGDIKIAGMTKEEVKNILTDILSEYIISPDINVRITGYNSKVVYVIGEVARPGKIFMQGDAITVREALVQAGLPLLSAATKKCRLITPTEKGKPKIKYVNVFALLYEGDLRQNYILKPGDTLYIPATVMAKAMRVISPVAQPIGATAGTARTVYPGY